VTPADPSAGEVQPGGGPPPVRIQIVAPLDPEAMPIGGIAAFVRGFVKFAPEDLAIELVGTSVERPLGRWRSTILEGRSIAHLPVARTRSATSGVPLAATYTLGLLRHRARLRPGAVQQFHRPGTALPLLRGRDPRVAVVHLRSEDLAGGRSESRWRHLPLALRLVERVTIQRMARVYVVNDEAARAYRAAYPGQARQIMFVPNWVDDETFQAPDDQARAAIRASLRSESRLDDGDRILLVAARLERQKDPMLALGAAAEVMRRRADVALVLAGEGRLRAELELEATRLGVAGRVRLLGAIERPELARWMAAADALVIASVIETGPTVGLEALATGLPVVTTEVGTIAGLVATGGCGAVAADHTPEGLADAIERVLVAGAAGQRAACLAAVGPYRARAVLPRLYDDARRLAGAGMAGAPEPDPVGTAAAG
jgi:glycosyltransferase involved in cell wall biosynthesis